MSKPYGIRARVRSINAALKERWDNLRLTLGMAANDNAGTREHRQIRAEESSSRSADALPAAASLP